MQSQTAHSESRALHEIGSHRMFFSDISNSRKRAALAGSESHAELLERGESFGQQAFTAHLFNRRPAGIRHFYRETFVP
jgi:hypothetical protein